MRTLAGMAFFACEANFCCRFLALKDAASDLFPSLPPLLPLAGAVDLLLPLLVTDVELDFFLDLLLVEGS